MKFERIYPRDVIALIVLVGCGFLISRGINGVVSAIAVSIIAYYFSKRIYEENHEEILIRK